MELLIARHGETTTSTGVNRSPDAALSDNGMRQACATGAWVDYNVVCKGFVGYTSPFLAPLQTASVFSESTEVPFTVDMLLRDFRFEKKGVDITSGSAGAEPVHRLPEYPMADQGMVDNSHFYGSETIDQFIVRCQRFLYNAQEAGYDKVLAVTHATVAVLLTELAIGKTVEEIRQELAQTEEFVRSSDKKLINTNDRFKYLSGIRHCGLCRVSDGKPIYFARVVYE
jgi:broad specificity phosphatase PhoE